MSGGRVRARRIALLVAELRDLQTLASERSRSADSKAGFLAVTSGIVLGAGPWLSFPRLEWWISGIPLVLSLAAICLAILALRVRGRLATNASKLVERWKDSDRRAEDLRELAVEFRARDITATELSTSTRIRFTKVGLILLLAAVTSIGVLYIIQNSIK